jgi:uroporphyrinogen III methyltransferase / synthase
MTNPIRRRDDMTAQERQIGPWAAGSGQSGPSARVGIVYLVGAGPGDPGLMTVRSLELISGADAIFYDRLIPPGALAGARADAELVYIGKRPGVPSIPQEEIGERLVAAAKEGRSVVRLKGGDPFVFGRGGEEGEALREAGVEFEVVPGITAGVAATAYAGIPVTHRDDASAVAFVTGHEDPEKEESALDWEALARFPGTLVFYMGVKRLAENAAALIEAGRSPDEPAAAIECGTMAGQRTLVATLGTIAEGVAHEEIEAPALIVVGEVARRREQLAWLERRPLHGRRVVVTRARAQASGLATTLRGLGAEVVELPAIRIEPRIESGEVKEAVARIAEYDVLCLTSPNGVRLLFEAMDASSGIAEAAGPDGGQGLDARALAGAMVAAIGPGTARALAEHGIAADVVPERFVAEALVEALADVEVEGKRVLVARAAEAREVLPDALRERGAEVDVVALYETVRETPAETEIERAQAADYVTFTSSSTVTNLVEALGDRFPSNTRIVSIGPVTSEAARAAGLRVDVEAERHDIDGLLTALLADAAG